MELNDAIRIPLAPDAVWEALNDTALVRASIAHCESLRRLAAGEYALTLTVPLGPLRGRYEVRAHLAAETSAPMLATPRRVLNFRARADGIGSLRGQIAVSLRPDDDIGDPARTRIDYSVWATLAGPLAELPSRQIDNALHEVADDFFTEFCAVVQAKHGTAPNRVSQGPRRTYVFRRPISLAGAARRAHLVPAHGGGTAGERAAGALRSEHAPNAMPNWAWAALIFFVALVFYVARRLTSG